MINNDCQKAIHWENLEPEWKVVILFTLKNRKFALAHLKDLLRGETKTDQVERGKMKGGEKQFPDNRGLPCSSEHKKLAL